MAVNIDIAAVPEESERVRKRLLIVSQCKNGKIVTRSDNRLSFCSYKLSRSLYHVLTEL